VQKVRVVQKSCNYVTSLVCVGEGTFFLIGDSTLYRRTRNQKIEGGDTVLNAMKMSDGTLHHIDFNSLVQEVDKVDIVFEA